MQAFVSIVTAALLFIHTVVGCCWHHAHGCDRISAVAVSQPAKCCHHHQHSGESNQPQKPCKADCEGGCIYVVPQKLTVEAPQWASFDVLAVLPSLADHRIDASATWELGWSPPDVVPPLRTHLLHQVLLN